MVTRRRPLGSPNPFRLSKVKTSFVADGRCHVPLPLCRYFALMALSAQRMHQAGLRASRAKQGWSSWLSQGTGKAGGEYRGEKPVSLRNALDEAVNMNFTPLLIHFLRYSLGC